MSVSILLDEIQNAYEQLARSDAVLLPAIATSCADWARGLAAYARSEDASREPHFWRALPWLRRTPLPQDGVDS